jgi:hypothetical protein
MSDQHVLFNDDGTHMFNWKHYLHHAVCQNSKSDLMMNVHTWATDNINHIMLYVRSLYQI